MAWCPTSLVLRKERERRAMCVWLGRHCRQESRQSSSVFDYATNQTHWNSAEIPAGNAVPATHTLPSSLFLSSRPNWWGTMPWPAIGPDVTGGQDPAGHAYKIPARVCYDNTSKDSNGILIFNANICYNDPVAPDTTPPTVS